ncbi:MAG: hypothetical protein AMXMBFR34_40960 [Myxococcaceae bacterium]
MTDGGTDGGASCDPLAAPGANGCSSSQKCTWITVQETPTSLGQLGCVPNGTVATGGTCTQGPAGATTGFDDCAATNVCINTRCERICDPMGGTQCAGYGHCSLYAGLFANDPDNPPWGACVAGCDPVTQTQYDGGTCGTNQGCYLLTDSTTTIAVCAGAGTVMHNQDISGTAFANSCVPGAQPRRKDMATMTMQCGGLCRPNDVTQGMNTADEGGVSPYTCMSHGAAPPSDTTAGESCRFWWSREPFNTLSPYSNTVGWCFKHAVFQYDSNGDMTPDTPQPRCVNVTTGDVLPPLDNPPYSDALYFWCIQSPAMRAVGGGALKRSWAREEPRLDRLGNWRR